MLKYRVVSTLISIAVFLAVLTPGNGISRNKRQAPNINVHEIPKTSFSCADKKVGEYYADAESYCQVYHVCIPGMHDKLSLISFVCPNGTIFSQATRVCTPFDRVDCRLTSQFTENVNGKVNSGRNNYVDVDYESYETSPPSRSQPQPPRQNVPSRSRTTPAPPPPQSSVVTQTYRNRFRSGSNQFREPAPAATPRPTVRTTIPPQPPLPVRGAIVVPARPAPAGFRSSILSARPPQAGPGLANLLPPRPTPRAAVSTSTSAFIYEEEYDYDYEDEQPAAEQPNNARSKRDIIIAEDYELVGKSTDKISSFTCQDKVPGATYADVESNCEMFHICVLLGKHKVLDYKVFCANGTAFDQESGTCLEEEKVVCENSYLFYQFEKSSQPISNKKAISSKKKYTKSKKPTLLSKE